MRILVIGSGGREHALAYRLSKEAEVYAAPGNPGMLDCAELVSVDVTDFEQVAKVCAALSVNLVVVGPEGPLIAGIADELRLRGFNVFGPGREGAQLEASKAYSKRLMSAIEVPTAAHEVFQDPWFARNYARERFDAGQRVVVKASGDALGKGAIVCDSREEAEAAIDMMMVDRAFGSAGETVVIEQRLSGREFSLMTVCSEGDFYSLPIAQDHKRAFDDDQGPNTGGMGSISPVSWVSDSLVRETEHTIVAPILRHLSDHGISYRGALFAGIMLDEGKPYCLEFNVRFGDPETQSVMMRIGDGFANSLLSAAKGLPLEPPKFLDNSSVTVVVASEGYPGTVKRGKQITFGPLPDGVQVFHAGTTIKEGQLLTSGGRVVGVTASGLSIAQAKHLAYEGTKSVQFDGAWCRSDIGG